MQTMRVPVAMAAVAASLVLCGCAATAATAGDEPITREDLPAIAASSEQLAALTDGVTDAEYQAAFDEFEACMNDAGYPLVRVGRSDYLIEYSFLAEAHDSGESDRCYFTHFQRVDERWQFQHKDVSLANQIYQACLMSAGITPKTASEEVWQQLLEADLDPEACVEKFGPEQ